MFKHAFCVVSLVLSSFAGVSKAHDSSLATLQIIRLQPDKWAFEVRSPLYGLDHAMREFNAEKNTDLEGVVVGSNKYKEFIVEYIKATFDVTALTNSADTTNGQGHQTIKLRLGPGRIKLDDHVSTLIFEIIDMPTVNNRLEFRLPYMSYNEVQHNVLRLIDDTRSQRYILSSTNDFTVVDTDFFNNKAND